MTSWNPALPADSSKIRLSAGYIRNNESAVQIVLTSSNLTNGYPYIPNTTPIYFYADVAPSGWTIYNTVTDCLLALKGGSSQYNTTGGTGTAAGTWTGPGHNLTQNEISQSFQGASGANQFCYVVGGANQPHHHDWTSTRPTAAVGILCTKNP